MLQLGDNEVHKFLRLAEHGIQEGGSQEQERKNNGGNKNTFFYSPASAVGATFASKYRRKPSSALLQQNSCNKQQGYDYLSYIKNCDHALNKDVGNRHNNCRPEECPEISNSKLGQKLVRNPKNGDVDNNIEEAEGYPEQRSGDHP